MKTIMGIEMKKLFISLLIETTFSVVKFSALAGIVYVLVTSLKLIGG